MGLCKEQLKEKRHPSIIAGKGKKWVKNQYNRYIRRTAKKIDHNHPKINRYRGWFD